MTDWNDILKDEEALNEQELMKYLEGNPSAEERYAIEKQMAESDFMNDAVEGLQQFHHPTKLLALRDQLNKQLRIETGKKVKRVKNRKIKDQQWLVITVLAILSLCVFGYLIIHFYLKK